MSPEDKGRGRFEDARSQRWLSVNREAMFSRSSGPFQQRNWELYILCWCVNTLKRGITGDDGPAAQGWSAIFG